MSARWPYPRVIAHRGGGTLAPENTLAAIRMSLALGFRAVEFDAMLPADDEPVLMHDPTLQRTAGRAVAVNALSATQLGEVDVGSWHSPPFAGEPVPTLAQALAFCRRHDIWTNIEIKPTAGREKATGAAVARVSAQAYGASGASRAAPPLLSSFSVAALEAARATSPGIARGWLVERIPSDWQATLVRLGAKSLHVDHRKLTAALVRSVTGAGFGLFCYTVNDGERARELFGWGVDAVCTDRIDLIGPDFAEHR
jgi:glycerophosphoryl diester phosphodiesterase